jgi:[protein-PII] uridylyltransferase
VSAPASWTTTRFSEQRKQLLSDESLQGAAFCRAYAAVADEWLTELLGDETGVALVAVGGYGREELAPGSDLDVVLLHRDRYDDIDGIAQRVWYPIWEEGIQLDHSVNTLDGALDVADHDLDAALGYLDARLIAGERELATELRRRARDNWRANHRRWIPVLDTVTTERQRRWGDVAFLLEPDLKQGHGGLRDVHGMRALANAIDLLPPLDHAIETGATTLLDARVALHRQIRRGDQLLLQEQDGVARALGFDDADALMQQVSAAARSISWASDDSWHRVRRHLAVQGGRVARADRALSEGVVERDGEIAITSDAAVTDPALSLRLATASATSGVPIERASLERLRTEAAGPGDRWPDHVREALVQLFAIGSAAIPAFEALDQYGLITRLLPEWEPVRCRRQHNPYHRFTVDRHLLEATALAADLAAGVSRPDLLLIGAWLHDLGKGYPGDHTIVGVELMTRIAARMGFPEPDVEVLVRLVRDHLLLADAATRRDIQDPMTLQHVADEVCDRQTLEILTALTEADSRATGDSAWSEWKAGLIAELVTGVTRVLDGQRPSPRDEELDPDLVALVDAMTAGEVIVRGGEDGRVVIVAPDRPGLFCQLSGLFAIQGLDVLAADLRTSTTASDGSGVAVDVFRVQPERGDEYDWDRFESNLAKVLDGRLALEPRIAERARAYKPAPRRRAGEEITSEVTVHNDASGDASVIEIRTGNAIGVLYHLARAFVDLQLDVRHAKVQTLGDEVVDSFYVVDRHGRKITGAEHLGELRRSVLFELARLDV